MDELDRALFSEGGFARGAYQPLLLGGLDVTTSTSTVGHHTSDVNDQHSSRDVRGDGVASHSSFMSAPLVSLSSVQFLQLLSFACCVP